MQSEGYGRLAKRMPCAVHVGPRRYAGLVLNVSQGGLFIQTNADASRGSPVGLELRAPGEKSGIQLTGTVAWRKAVPGQLRQLAGGGFGIRIERADERYYGALARWMRVETPDGRRGSHPAEPVAAPLPTWRVRVRADGSTRSRALTLEAESATEAREMALRHIGAGWRVIEIDGL